MIVYRVLVMDNDPRCAIVNDDSVCIDYQTIAAAQEAWVNGGRSGVVRAIVVC